jgi:hypothetical protein
LTRPCGACSPHKAFPCCNVSRAIYILELVKSNGILVPPAHTASQRSLERRRQSFCLRRQTLLRGLRIMEMAFYRRLSNWLGPAREIRLSGSFSRSTICSQMFADVFGRGVWGRRVGICVGWSVAGRSPRLRRDMGDSTRFTSRCTGICSKHFLRFPSTRLSTRISLRAI